MSRPKDLPSALQAWALANYGAGPAWAGTPQRAAPGNQALVPGVSRPAEIDNYLYGNAFDAAQGALNAVGELPALNWNGPIAIGATCISFAFSPTEQAWYACQAASTAAFRSADWGRTWTAVTLAATGANDIAVDTSGNICIVGSSGNVSEGPFVAYGTAIVWTNHAAVLANPPWGVVYEPVSATWCAVCVNAGVAVTAYTSTNRAAWTLRSFAAGWTSANANTATLGAGNGILVATTVDSTTTFRTSISANGGVTWTNDQQIAIGFTSTAAHATSRPAWSSVDGLWYIAVSTGSGTRKTAIFSSPDGITWTNRATLTTNDCQFNHLVVLGALLVAVNDDGRVFCSVNQGVNWFRCQLASIPSTTAQVQTVKAGSNGIAILAGTTMNASARIGLPLTAA